VGKQIGFAGRGVGLACLPLLRMLFGGSDGVVGLDRVG
jgi:hypothetical protein